MTLTPQLSQSQEVMLIISLAASYHMKQDAQCIQVSLKAITS